MSRIRQLDRRTISDHSDASAGVPADSAFPPGLEVCSWSLEPPGTPNTRCTAVHLLVDVPGGTATIRFKSGAAVDALIDALASHRRDVFGRRAGLRPRASVSRGRR